MGAGRTDGFVGILGKGALLGGLNVTYIFFTEGFDDEWFGVSLKELWADTGRVSTHIGDQTDILAGNLKTFVKPLGDGLGLIWGELITVIGLLLHGGGGEWELRFDLLLAGIKSG